MEVFYLFNWFALATCFAFSILLGMFWYNPRVFGGIWANAFGLQDGDLDIRAQTRSRIAGLVYNFLSLYGLAVVIRYLHITSALSGLIAGLFMAFFFAVAPMGNTAAFEQWRPARLLVHGTHRLVLLGAAGALLAWWQ